MQPRALRVPARGLDLAVLEWPAEGAPRGDVVLLHGLQDVAASWDLVAPALARAGHRVLAPDLRGFGDSGRVHASGYYYFPDYVFDLADLVDALAGEAPIALVGHSMGGTVAVMYAGLYPARVRALALLEGLGPPAHGEEGVVDRERAWIDAVRRLRSRPERAMSADDVAARLAFGHPGVPEDVLRRRATQLARPAPGGGFVWAFDPLHRTPSPIPFSLDRWREHARRITARTLAVGGGPTGFHPEGEAERVATIAGARTAEIPDAGHMMHWTRPDAVAALLLEHLRG
jgi:pimeloyl-ACP methyl ester carboxylesterase